jgi:hypothetical protein
VAGYNDDRTLRKHQGITYSKRLWVRPLFPVPRSMPMPRPMPTKAVAWARSEAGDNPTGQRRIKRRRHRTVEIRRWQLAFSINVKSSSAVLSNRHCHDCRKTEDLIVVDCIHRTAQRIDELEGYVLRMLRCIRNDRKKQQGRPSPSQGRRCAELQQGTGDACYARTVIGSLSGVAPAKPTE